MASKLPQQSGTSLLRLRGRVGAIACQIFLLAEAKHDAY